MKISHLLMISIMSIFVSCEEDKNTDYINGVVKTLGVTEIKTTSATCRGSLQIISEKGGYSFIENGICYATSQNPTTSDRKIIGERISKSGNTTITTKNPKDGEFTANLTGLQKNTTYFVRAYTINSFGTFYGNEISFTTLSVYNSYVIYSPVVWLLMEKVTVRNFLPKKKYTD